MAEPINCNRNIDNRYESSMYSRKSHRIRRFYGVIGGTLEYRRGIPGFAGAMTGTAIEPHRPPPSRRSGSSNTFATGEFDTLQASLYRLQSLSQFGEGFRGHQVVVRFEGQWSNDLLVPFEQFSIGGPHNVRGFQASEGLFDRGVFGSFEYQMPPPFIADKPAILGKTWGQLLQLSAFYDYAWGKKNDPLTAGEENFESRAYRAAGFAIEFRNGEKFFSRLTVAAPLNSPVPEQTTPFPARKGIRSNPRVWFEFNYKL